MDKLNSFAGLRLAALRAKGYTLEQISLLNAAMEDIFVDINESLEMCEAHAESAHADPNAIVGVKKNGKTIAPTNHVVDISVPTKTSELSNDSGFQTSDDVETAVTGKGYMVTEVVQTVPSASTAKANTIYYVPKEGGGYLEYQLVAGAVVLIGENAADLSGLATTAEIEKASDALIQSIVNTKTASAEKYVGTGNLALFWSLISTMVSGDTTALKALTARVEVLELFVMNGEIEGNPYSVTFDDLDGLTVSGVWNTSEQRIEF